MWWFVMKYYGIVHVCALIRAIWVHWFFPIIGDNKVRKQKQNPQTGVNKECLVTVCLILFVLCSYSMVIVTSLFVAMLEQQESNKSPYGGYFMLFIMKDLEVSLTANKHPWVVIYLSGFGSVMSLITSDLFCFLFYFIFYDLMEGLLLNYHQSCCR